MFVQPGTRGAPVREASRRDSGGDDSPSRNGDKRRSTSRLLPPSQGSPARERDSRSVASRGGGDRYAPSVVTAGSRIDVESALYDAEVGARARSGSRRASDREREDRGDVPLTRTASRSSRKSMSRDY